MHCMFSHNPHIVLTYLISRITYCIQDVLYSHLAVQYSHPFCLLRFLGFLGQVFRSNKTLSFKERDGIPNTREKAGGRKQAD